MTFFEYHNAGNGEAKQLQAFSYMLDQVSVGKAATGVLTGMSVAQTTTASESVVVSAGAGVVQAATLDGASLVGDVQDTTLDVLIGSPMGSVPRNDIVVADRATGSIRVIIGSPNVTPTDPSVPTSAVKLARIRNAANATAVPSSAIDDLRVFTQLFALDSGLITNAISPASGWSIGDQQTRRIGNTVHVFLRITRTGGTISGTFDGNIGNVTMGTVNTAYRPVIPAGAACGDGGWLFSASMSTSGTISINALLPNIDIVSGNSISMSFCYPVP